MKHGEKLKKKTETYQKSVKSGMKSLCNDIALLKKAKKNTSHDFLSGLLSQGASALKGQTGWPHDQCKKCNQR